MCALYYCHVCPEMERSPHGASMNPCMAADTAPKGQSLAGEANKVFGFQTSPLRDFNQPKSSPLRDFNQPKSSPLKDFDPKQDVGPGKWLW